MIFRAIFKILGVLKKKTFGIVHCCIVCHFFCIFLGLFGMVLFHEEPTEIAFIGFIDDFWLETLWPLEVVLHAQAV